MFVFMYLSITINIIVFGIGFSEGRIFPRLKDIREISIKIAIRIVILYFEEHFYIYAYCIE